MHCMILWQALAKSFAAQLVSLGRTSPGDARRLLRHDVSPHRLLRDASAVRPRGRHLADSSSTDLQQQLHTATTEEAWGEILERSLANLT